MRRPSIALVVACALGPGIALQLGACSDEPASDPATQNQDSGRPQLDPPPEEVPDAPPDAPPRPPPTIPGCVGDPLPLVPSGERTYVKVNMGSAEAGAIEGDFLLDFGANGSTIDFNAFSPEPPTPSSCLGDAGYPGALCYFPNFDFFGGWGSVGLYTADYGFLYNTLKQAGIIGTDFLSNYPFTIDFYDARIFRAFPDKFCTDAQLLGSGYSPIPTGGFYTNDTNTLRPLSDVITDTDAAGFVVPNVPTVPVTIAGVAALAQLDSGYDDRLYRHSINVNRALIDQLLAKNPSALTRKPQRDLYLTTCVPGLSQAGRAYEIVAGNEVNFINEGGSVGRHDKGQLLFVKDKLKDAERCGGIETWTVPAAQFGASFLVDAQAVVFDPQHSRVWMPAQ